MRNRYTRVSQVPPTPEEFAEIKAGRMIISAELYAFWRSCTDAELETWFRDPSQWSYVLRTPDGEVVADGADSTREECEEWAVRHAEEHTAENTWIVISEGVKIPSFDTLEEYRTSDFELDYRWNWSLLGKWRFVLWPPTSARRDVK